MLFLYGWGKRTTKDFGNFELVRCGNCNNVKQWSYKRYKTWFTLFFIPVIPYKTQYVRECPICRCYQELRKDAFYEVVNQVNGTGSQSTSNNGLTETQINYREQMAAAKSNAEIEQGESE